MSPSELVQLLKAVFPDAPKLIDRHTVRNIAYGERQQFSSRNDAHHVLEILINLQREDFEWYFETKSDELGRLTHLFWQSPTQRQLAKDCYQVLIHDNTYQSNRFRLPLGLFAGINRHGHTVTLGQALTSQEGTSDYEWEFDCYKKSTQIDPEFVWTDADPGATAAVNSVWPASSHGKFILLYAYLSLGLSICLSLCIPYLLACPACLP
jgi:hypothetical protein